MISVHLYKYSQDHRRKLLKRLWKDGHLEFLGRNKTHLYYKILNMEEYRKGKRK